METFSMGLPSSSSGGAGAAPGMDASNTTASSTTALWGQQQQQAPVPPGGFLPHTRTTSNSSSQRQRQQRRSSSMSSSGGGITTTTTTPQEEIDAYAQRVLEQAAAAAAASETNNDNPPLPVDDSLGSYITGCLRKSRDEAGIDATAALDVHEWADFDALSELIQEYCCVSEMAAKETLEKIAHAVVSGHLPTTTTTATSTTAFAVSGLLTTTATTSSTGGAGRSTIGGASVNPAETTTASAGDVLQEEENEPVLLSPMAANNLIPLDLLDEEEDNEEQVEQDSAAGPATDSTAAFPPLGAADAKNTDTIGSSCSSSAARNNKLYRAATKHHKSHSKQEKSAEADELAAALFQTTTRSRQSSIDESSCSVSPKLNSVGVPASTKSQQLLPPTITEATIDPTRQQQQDSYVRSGSNNNDQWRNSSSGHDDSAQNQNVVDDNNNDNEGAIHATAEFLLTMNAELSEDAALAAAAMAGGDVNLGQYVIEQARQQTPVCRHLLSDGCYRADCQFNHDIDNHTCMFWLKKYCMNGTNCKFLHGFSDTLLSNLPEILPQYYETFANHQQNVMDYAVNAAAGMMYPSEALHAYGNPAMAYDAAALYNSDNSGYSMTTAPYTTHTATASSTSSWIPSPPPSASVNPSFANVALQNFDTQQSFVTANNDTTAASSNIVQRRTSATIPTVPIPLELWNVHENRDASVFHIADPLERYYQTSSSSNQQENVIDLHFQSTKTFPIVLDHVLPTKLSQHEEVWIVTGTGHHVGTRTHQKGGGALERAVLEYLLEEYQDDTTYSILRGKDRSGQGGALLLRRRNR